MSLTWFGTDFENFKINIQELKSSSWGLLNIFNFKPEVQERVYILDPRINSPNILFLLNEKVLKKIDLARFGEETYKLDVIMILT